MTEYEQKQIFSSNLNRLIGLSGKEQKQIAFDLDEKPSTFNQWVKGKALPSIPKVHSLADYFGVPFEMLVDLPSDVISGEISPSGNFVVRKIQNGRKSPRKIPVLGRVAAGIPLEMIEDIIDEEEIPGDMVGEYFALQIKGDSMEPKISNGDVVIVRQQPDVESGQIAIVTVNGDDATCKRVMKYSDGIMLLSNNPNYAPMQFTKEEIENKPIKILGKVVELRAKFE